MERMYHGLSWVAGVAVVTALLMMAWVASNQGQLYVSSYAGDAYGWGSLGRLTYLLPGMLNSIVTDLMVGTAILAAVVAWSDQRWRWFIALVGTIAISLLFSNVVAYLQQTPFFFIHPRIGQFIQQNYLLIGNGLIFLPCALAIVMTRMRVEYHVARAAGDTEIGITRSRL
jgi:hypothetical protein